ncbi:uncharacterized protein LOC108033572 [Drosophila biarmipes]|uniref:uncharacterized protein LOC108033572 n=1 Tax=Drosophila biarmipes TaxID=125945 RepID=UPI0007E72C49|nr:uncharacterized protein LOC108033572 [Drosophila biarmipes]
MMNWFNNICAESRLKFLANHEEPKVQRESKGGLMSAEECYSFIRKNIRPKSAIQEEVFWKIPILLVCLGCIIVILMAFCFAFQCLVTRAKAARLPKQLNFDICKVESSKNHPAIHKASQSEQPTYGDGMCCTCMR